MCLRDICKDYARKKDEAEVLIKGIVKGAKVTRP
jgi:hypothetical protein